MSNLKIKVEHSTCEKLFAAPFGATLTDSICGLVFRFFNKKTPDTILLEYYSKFSIMVLNQNE